MVADPKAWRAAALKQRKLERTVAQVRVKYLPKPLSTTIASSTSTTPPSLASEHTKRFLRRKRGKWRQSPKGSSVRKGPTKSSDKSSDKSSNKSYHGKDSSSSYSSNDTEPMVIRESEEYIASLTTTFEAKDQSR